MNRQEKMGSKVQIYWIGLGSLVSMKKIIMNSHGI